MTHRGLRQVLTCAGVFIALLLWSCGDEEPRDESVDYSISTVIGTGVRGIDDRTGPAVEAQLDDPVAIARAADGTLYIADAGNGVRAVHSGEIRTVVSARDIADAQDVAIAEDHALYIGGPSRDGSRLTVYRYDLVTSNLTDWLAEVCGVNANSPDPLLCPRYHDRGLALRAGEVLLGRSSGSGDQVYAIPPNHVPYLVAGHGPSGIGFDLNEAGAAQGARISKLGHLAVAPAGQVYFSDLENCRVRKIDGNGIVHTVAGGGGSPIARGPSLDCGFSGDGGLATTALLTRPGASYGLALGLDNDLLMTDGVRLRRVDRRGTIYTVAGTGEQECLRRGRCCPGDGGPAASAALAGATALAVSPSGEIWLAEAGGNCPRIRMLSPAPRN